MFYTRNLIATEWLWGKATENHHVNAFLASQVKIAFGVMNEIYTLSTIHLDTIR